MRSLVCLLCVTLIPSVAQADEDADKIAAMCVDKFAELKIQMAELRARVKTKDWSFEVPPLYHYACRGHPNSAERDAAEDEARKKYVADGFMAADMVVIRKITKTFHDIELLGCQSKKESEQLNEVFPAIGDFMARRFKQTMEAALAAPGTEKYDRFRPLIDAMIRRYDERRSMATEKFMAREIETYIFPLARELYKEHMRRVEDDHDLRITPEILSKLAKEAALLGPLARELEDIGAILERLWRFKVSVKNNWVVPSEEGELGGWVEFSNKPFWWNDQPARRKLRTRLPYYNPGLVTFNYERVLNGDGQFQGPWSFKSPFDFNLEPCEKEPTAYVFVGNLGARYEKFLYPTHDNPGPVELPGFIYGSFADLMADIAQPPGPSELDITKLRFPMVNREVKVVHHTLSHGRELPDDGGVMVDNLTVTITHVPQ